MLVYNLKFDKNEVLHWLNCKALFKHLLFQTNTKILFFKWTTDAKN